MNSENLKSHAPKKLDENQGFFVGNILQKGYGILPNIVLFDKEISSTSKLLYCLISSLCAEKGYCYAQNQYLADMLGLSKFNITRLLNELNKYLNTENASSFKRRIFINSTSAKMPTNIGKNAEVNLSKNADHNNINNNIITKINISFDFFWKEYDKKVGNKPKLEKKWNELKDDDRQKIINYLPGYRKNTPEKRYRKNAETFLNNRSWEDELIDSTEKKKTSEVVLHDGSKAVQRSGTWFDARNPYVKIDLNYYPELRNL